MKGLRTYDEFKPHRKPVEIAADCVRKGDKLAVEAGNCIVRLDRRIVEADRDHAKLREALERIRPFVDLDYKTHEGVRVGEIIDAALNSKGAERE